MSEIKIYKPVKETANYFKCGDCGESVHKSVADGICRGYGPSFAFQAQTRRCSVCLRKLAQDSEVWYKFTESIKKFNSEIEKA